MPLLLERALFIVAPQDSGKSTALRSMFVDRRLGMAGVIPPSTQNRLPETIHLSNERRLYMRLTSPHENNENVAQFLSKTKGKMVNGRWCYVGPFQPEAFKQMPDIVETVHEFIRAFHPERVRVVFLSPNRHGQCVENFLLGRDLRGELLNIRGVEVVCLDGRQKGKNGLFLADFFDFT